MNRLFTAVNLAYLALSVPLVLLLFLLSTVALALDSRGRAPRQALASATPARARSA